MGTECAPGMPSPKQLDARTPGKGRGVRQTEF